MADIPIPNDGNLHQTLIQIVKMLHAHNLQFGKIQGALMAHRRAIASTHSDPIAFENQLRQFELDTQDLALETQGFPEASALIALMEAGKDPDTFDT